MQLANIQLALGGDPINTVVKSGGPPPRYPLKGQTSRGCVTAAEIPVLQMIHGESSVTDVEPAGEWDIGNREERARLAILYGEASCIDGEKRPVDRLYPGVAARVFERLDELELNESLFKAERRVTANSAPTPEAMVVAGETPTKELDDGGQGTRKRRTGGGKSGGSEVGRAADGGDQGVPAVGLSPSGGQGAVADGSGGHVGPGQQGSAERSEAVRGASAGARQTASSVRQAQIDEDGIGAMPDNNALFG